jgi:hypothetical protein
MESDEEAYVSFISSGPMLSCSLIAHSSGIIQSNNVNHRLCYSPSITGVPFSGDGTAYQLTSSCVSMDRHRHSDDGRAVVLELKIVLTSR